MTTLAEVRAALAMADRLAEAVLTMEPIIGRAKEYAGLRSACGSLPVDGVIVTPDSLARAIEYEGDLCLYDEATDALVCDGPTAHAGFVVRLLRALAAEGGPA